MFRFVFVTDTQHRGTNPRNRKDDFVAASLLKVREIGDIARTHKVDAVLHGGDFWDYALPAPNVAAMYISAWRDALGNTPLYVVPGNHDELGHNPEIIHRTMLGFGAKLGLYRLLTQEPVVLEKDGLSVQITGQAYHFDIDRRDPRLDYVPLVKVADKAIHIVHGMLVREPLYPGAPYTPISAIWDQTEADLTLAGHNHLGFPLTEHKGKLFYSPGALVRVKKDPRDMNRQVVAVLIEVTKSGIAITDIPLKSARPAEEVFVMEEKTDPEAEERQARLRAFIEAVKESGRRPGEDVMTYITRLAQEGRFAPEVVAEAKRRLSLVQERMQKRGEVVHL